jgi:hypothetical protein
MTAGLSRGLPGRGWGAGAPSHLPAQRISQPPRTPVAQPARRRMHADGDLRAAPRRGVGAGRRDRHPPARLCFARGRIGRDPAALLERRRTRSRPQPRGTADHRPRARRFPVDRLQAHYEAARTVRGTGGQRVFLPGFTKRAAPDAAGPSGPANREERIPT